jgi:hypothetical protein
VAIELQADCLAGVWGASTQERGILEKGEVKEALDAASAIGDDRLEQQAGVPVNPDSFTHGSSEQRVAAFEKGFRAGRPEACAR